MRNFLHAGTWVLVLLLGSVAGCSSSKPCYTGDPAPDAVRSIFVIRRGWHTGVAVAAADWPDRGWSLLADFPDAHYLEFGWGDERFYQAEKGTPWLATRAALWPTASVIHVIGLKAPLRDHIEADDIAEVRIPIESLRLLTTSIEQEFSGVSPVATGLPMRAAPVPNGFYEAKRSFYFPRMCNWWIAARLQVAGCPIQPWTVITASQVMRKARGFAE